MSVTRHRICVHGYGDNLEGRDPNGKYPRVHITGRTSDNDEMSSLCFDPAGAYALAEAIRLAAEEAERFPSADVSRTVYVTVTEPDDPEEPIYPPPRPEPAPSPIDDEIPF